ncbi:hypothetical protein HDV57DRAFT_510232 [Trichoderma longibrachiatum]
MPPSYTSTLKLEEFLEDSIPPYAILSHTWGSDSDELTFRQVENGEIDKQTLGSIKLRGCCQQAQKDGLGYAWIDTCCIDKTNLVELSEAINSMYRWYSRASVCYAYLSDVPDNDVPPRPGSKFRSSRWFQRGWTLQELLAPKLVRFYNSEWRSIGTKGTICAVIKNITRVPQQYLLGITSLHGASVAQRMSWAAQRQTKRAEDMAYCLLGIFNVTMPMIYGEGGEQAFFRLQEQIMKTTRDDSILAWGLSDGPRKPAMDDKGELMGGEILATSPSSFATSAQIVARDHTPSPLHSLDVYGGSVRVHMTVSTTPGGETYGLLSCGPGSNREQVVGIPLARVNSGATNEYIRPVGCPSVLQPIAAAGSPPQLIHIKRDGRRDASAPINQQYWVYDEDLFARVNLTLVDVEPHSCWDEQMNLISAIRSDDGSTDRILLRFRYAEAESRDFVVILNIAPVSKTDPHFHVMICSRDTPLMELLEKHRHISSTALGKSSASNGTLHLQFALESVEEGLMCIKPRPMDKPPSVTVDMSAELEKSNLLAEFTQLLRDRREAKEEEVELHARSTSRGNRWQLAKKEREAVDHQIKQLREKRRRLVVEEIASCREAHILEQKQGKVKKRQGDIVKQLSRAFDRLAELQFFDDAEAANTLLQNVKKHGDAEVSKLFDDTAVEASMMHKYGTPLIAASIKGDAGVVRQLLATSEVEIDRKDTKHGRTALGWASANGHDAVVRLLLDTTKVDVNSTDNDGWSPLHWALQNKHDKVFRLLMEELVISKDSQYLVSASSQAKVEVWNPVTGQSLNSFEGSNGQSCVAVSPDSMFIVSGSLEGAVNIWKTTVSGSNDNTIKIWNALTGKCQQTLHGHSGGVKSVAFSHDARMVCSWSSDSTIKLWGATSGRCLQTVQVHGSEVVSVAFSHDSKRMVSGSKDETVEDAIRQLIIPELSALKREQSKREQSKLEQRKREQSKREG